MRASVAALAAAAVLAAALGWAGTPAVARSGRALAGAPGRTGEPAVAPAAEPVVAGGAPGCSTAAAPAPALRTVATPTEPVPGSPFGVVVTADGRWAFVSLPGSGSVGVFRVRGAGVPALVRRVDIGGQPVGEALTPGGRYLLVADAAGGAEVVSVSRAERAGTGARVGTLSDPAGSGAIEVAVSPDRRFAFVSLEGSAAIAVFNLRRALTDGFGRSDLVGTIPVGFAPVGLAVSPGGRWLYAISEIAARPRFSQARSDETPGTLTVINLRRAETDPAVSVASTVTAGCGPVRVITSADGAVVWVTARGSDRLLGFSAARLLTDPGRSLIATVEVGEAPVGLALVGGGTRIVVADSDRFSTPGAASALAVVDVAAALAGRPALLGYLPAGSFPRQMALEPEGGVLLVTDFAARRLEAVDLAHLP